MIDQLLISKKLYQEACRQLSFDDPVSDGVAVSLFQDAVEIYIWTLIKDRGIEVGKNQEFTNNLGLLSNSGLSIPIKAKLLELNKARVNFKHYGNLPAHRDAEKFRGYTQDFLVQACLEHFALSFTEISIAHLIRSRELQEYFKEARDNAESDQLFPAYENLGKARWVLFGELSARLPRFNAQAQADSRNAGDFETLRELLLVAIHRIDLREYKFAIAALPATARTASGRFHTNHTRSKYSLEEFNRIHDFLIDLCIKEAL